MQILCISDTHNEYPSIVTNIQADLIIHCGDFTDNGTTSETYKFLCWYENLPFQYKILIAGNHDLYCEKNHEDMLNFCSNNGIIYLCNSEIILEGIKFWGSPFTPYCGRFAFQSQDHWNKIPKDTDVLITHGPPSSTGTLSKAYNGYDLGCLVLKNFVNQIKPKFHIFGHIHEGQGTYKENDTTFINCARGVYKFTCQSQQKDFKSNSDGG